MKSTNIIKRLRKMNEAPPRRFRCLDEDEVRQVLNHVGTLNNMLRELRSQIELQPDEMWGYYNTKAVDGSVIHHPVKESVLRKIDICLDLEELDA